MRRAQSTIALAAILLTGCSTVAVERAKDLSSAGIQYSQATAGVIDVASNAAVDADSEAQVTSKPRQPVADAEQERRAVRLEQLDADLVRTVSLYATLKRSVNALEAYFKALQDLANGSQADATGGVRQLRTGSTASTTHLRRTPRARGSPRASRGIGWAR